MGQDNNSKNSDDFSSLFSKVREAQIEPSPYMKTRILARVREQNPYRKSLMFWRLFSGLSAAAVVALAVLSLRLYQASEHQAITAQSYVIHVEFNESDKNAVARAEVSLPADVHFVTSNKKVREERQLVLPVAVKALGRGKLPFVVASDSGGEKEIKVRLLNDKDELVREQVLKVKFAKQDSSNVF